MITLFFPTNLLGEIADNMQATTSIAHARLVLVLASNVVGWNAFLHYFHSDLT